MNTDIAFIGAGNMARALIEGLIARDTPAGSILVSDADPAKGEALQRDCGVRPAGSNAGAVRQAGIVVLAVKPQVMRDVLAPLAEVLAERPVLLISIAAGIPLDSLQAWTSTDQAIVRCMPNTPALVGAGASGLFANAATSGEQQQQAEAILSAVGTVCWLNDESEMDAVTALSGSGPAYFFLLMEAMQEAGVKLGLDGAVARDLSLQTAYGAALLAKGSDVDVAELRHRVTSPGGTTEAALKQFLADDFMAIVERALGKAAERSRELAAESGKS